MRAHAVDARPARRHAERRVLSLDDVAADRRVAVRGGSGCQETVIEFLEDLADDEGASAREPRRGVCRERNLGV